MLDQFRSWIMEGHYRMTGYNPETKEHRIYVNKKNTIMLPATYVAARGFAGLSNPGISHLYLGYTNNGNFPPVDYAITANDTEFHKGVLSGVSGSATGFLRIPINMPAIIDAQPTYTLLTFNILVNAPEAYVVDEAPASSALTSDVSSFYEAGLVSDANNSGSRSDIAGDKLVARVSFNNLVYSSTFNITVSWGLKFQLA